MATKTITIREEVYDRLKSIKGDKSFSELLDDLAEERQPDLEESFGAWKGDKKELRKTIEEGREKFDEELRRGLE